MARTQVREVKYKSSQYMRVLLYNVRKVGGRKTGTRVKRGEPTREVQAALNERNAARMLSDIIHLNFTPEDCAIHPTYTDKCMPGNDEEAHKGVTNYIRRIRRLYYKLHGTVKGFKYVYVTEKTKTGRYHHHLVVSAYGVSFKELINAWGMGRCNPRHLEFDENGLVGLAHYYVKDPVGSRRWGCSKGLARPAPRTCDTKFSQKDAASLCGENPDTAGIAAKHYPGWTISDVNTNVTFGGTFIEIFLYKTDNAYFNYDRWGRIHYRFESRE